VEVTKNSKIDGAYDGKNAWDNAIQGLAPCLLNLAVVKVSEQNPMDMAKLQKKMDEMFEYANHELKARGFKDCVGCFMKGECCCFKKRYSKGGQRDCPMGVEQTKWINLFGTSRDGRHKKSLNSWQM
jgi:hypothetical protein